MYTIYTYIYYNYVYIIIHYILSFITHYIFIYIILYMTAKNLIDFQTKLKIESLMIFEWFKK